MLPKPVVPPKPLRVPHITDLLPRQPPLLAFLAKWIHSRNVRFGRMRTPAVGTGDALKDVEEAPKAVWRGQIERPVDDGF